MPHAWKNSPFMRVLVDRWPFAVGLVDFHRRRLCPQRPIIMAESDAQLPNVKTSLPAAAAGARLDKFLATLWPDFSRARIQQLIAEGHIRRADGAGMDDPAYKIRLGDSFTLSEPPPRPSELIAEDIALHVLYEDDAVLVVNKPAGMVMHPAAGNAAGTLVHALLAHCGGSLSGIGGEQRPGIVHRLDKDTSGIVVIAKHDQAHRHLSAQFAAHSIKRIYNAWVWGSPKTTTGRIEGNIGRSPYNRQKMALVKKGGKSAVTHYRILKAYGLSASLIECRLETGRTHQIRVHLTHLGHSLIGDAAYGGKVRAPKTALETKAGEYLYNFNRQALHAGTLGFAHPTSQAWLEFNQAWPEDLQKLDASLLELF